MNTFHLKLEATAMLTRRMDCDEPSKYSMELDDIRSLVADLCDLLSEQPQLRFVIQGFDESPWPATVRTDLALVIEQLPEVLRGLKNATPVVLDFYEQGLERAVEISGTGPLVTLTCTSRHEGWKPRPPTISSSRRKLVQMFRELADDFIGLGSDVCPDLMRHGWMTAWATEVRSNS